MHHLLLRNGIRRACILFNQSRLAAPRAEGAAAGPRQPTPPAAAEAAEAAAARARRRQKAEGRAQKALGTELVAQTKARERVAPPRRARGRRAGRTEEEKRERVVAARANAAELAERRRRDEAEHRAFCAKMNRIAHLLHRGEDTVDPECAQYLHPQNNAIPLRAFLRS